MIRLHTAAVVGATVGLLVGYVKEMVCGFALLRIRRHLVLNRKYMEVVAHQWAWPSTGRLEITRMLMIVLDTSYCLNCNIIHIKLLTTEVGTGVGCPRKKFIRVIVNY